MRVGIMQPYFLPYVGYFQLMNFCDVFVIYDDIQFSKGGWINRNRMLLNGEPRMFTLPLQRASDYLDIRDRVISPTFEPKQLMNSFRQAYSRAPNWRAHQEAIEEILKFPSRNLFEFTAHSIERISSTLGISSRLVVSSQLSIENGLRGQDRVLATCEVLGATQYVNPIGGLDLYSEKVFRERGIELTFLRSAFPPYPQFDLPFVGMLSIVDVLMFADPQTIYGDLATRFENVVR